MLTLVTGLLAGFFHVLSGPDHLAAVAPLAIADRRRGWLAGWSWGLGHTLGVMLVAAAAVWLRDLFPPIEVISAWSERLVGGALIAVGLWAFRKGARIQEAPHAHGVESHDHLHVQAGPSWFRRAGHAHASLAMGVLHGLAGSSHFIGVLPALALPTRTAAFVYIGAFGLGTVLAMAAFAAVVSRANSRFKSGSTAHRGLMITAAVMAVVVGSVWLAASK
jgi:hypothetical protein